jgi:hypothetical protein
MRHREMVSETDTVRGAAGDAVGETVRDGEGEPTKSVTEANGARRDPAMVLMSFHSDSPRTVARRETYTVGEARWETDPAMVLMSFHSDSPRTVARNAASACATSAGRKARGGMSALGDAENATRRSAAPSGDTIRLFSRSIMALSPPPAACVEAHPPKHS